MKDEWPEELDRLDMAVLLAACAAAAVFAGISRIRRALGRIVPRPSPGDRS